MAFSPTGNSIIKWIFVSVVSSPAFEPFPLYMRNNHSPSFNYISWNCHMSFSQPAWQLGPRFCWSDTTAPNVESEATEFGDKEQKGLVLPNHWAPKGLWKAGKLKCMYVRTRLWKTLSVRLKVLFSRRWESTEVFGERAMSRSRWCLRKLIWEHWS